MDDQEVHRNWSNVCPLQAKVTFRKHSVKEQAVRRPVAWWLYLKCGVLNKLVRYLRRVPVSFENLTAEIRKLLSRIRLFFFFFLTAGAPGSISTSENGLEFSKYVKCGVYSMWSTENTGFYVHLAGGQGGYALTKFLSMLVNFFCCNFWLRIYI